MTISSYILTAPGVNRGPARTSMLMRRRWKRCASCRCVSRRIDVDRPGAARLPRSPVQVRYMVTRPTCRVTRASGPCLPQRSRKAFAGAVDQPFQPPGRRRPRAVSGRDAMVYSVSAVARARVNLPHRGVSCLTFRAALHHLLYGRKVSLKVLEVVQIEHDDRQRVREARARAFRGRGFFGDGAGCGRR